MSGTRETWILVGLGALLCAGGVGWALAGPGSDANIGAGLAALVGAGAVVFGLATLAWRALTGRAGRSRSER